VVLIPETFKIATLKVNIMKILKAVFFFIAPLTFLLLLDPGICNAERETSKKEQTLLANPFTLAKNRIVPEGMIFVKVDKSFEKDKHRISEIALEYAYEEKRTLAGKTEKIIKQKTVIIRDYFFKWYDSDLYLMIQMPSRGKLKTIKDPIFQIPDANLKISLKGHERPFVFRVEIPSVTSALLWGAGIVFLAAICAWFLTIKLQEDSPKGFLGSFILRFAVTPVRSYSISKTQIMIWTYITLFGLVYVYLLTGNFMSITNQVLILLGVGGGTALGAKMNALSRVPRISSKYLELVKEEEQKKLPHLRDLITIDKRPNIFKFQILVFTLFTAFVVFIEILENYAFPEIPDGLITLMGISSGVYLGNEVIYKNPWDAIKEKTGIIENIVKEHNISITTTADLRKIVELETEIEKSKKTKTPLKPAIRTAVDEIGEEKVILELGKEIEELEDRLKKIYT
jgi:hypothetical protein